jgi:hypothetical protein
LSTSHHAKRGPLTCPINKNVVWNRQIFWKAYKKNCFKRQKRLLLYKLCREVKYSNYLFLLKYLRHIMISKINNWIFDTVYIWNIKGTVSQDVRPSVFSWINSTWVTDQWVKIFLHMVANSQSNSWKCVDSVLCGIVRSCNSLLCDIVWSRNSQLCGIAWSRLSAVPHSTELARKFLTWISH